MKWLRENLKGDPVIWFIVLLLSVMSVLVVYSATGTLAYKSMQGNTEHYLIKHGSLVGLGLVCMWLAHRIDYRQYSRLSRVALWFSVVLLIFSFFFGTTLNAATRQVTIPIIRLTFQPSDLAKLALITNLASMLAKRQQRMDKSTQSLYPVLIWIGIICGLIGLTNFSNSLLLFVTCVLLMFIGRVPIRFFVGMIAVGLIAGTFALGAGQRLETAKHRIEDFAATFTGEKDPPFQAEQSLIAIATGGVVGKGVGHSSQRNVLPHPYSDFVYAIIIEEYGLIGGAFVLFLYLALLYRGMRAVARSDRAFGGLLSAGLSLGLVLQAMINMGVAVGLGPITGLPLPLLSMGGTSLLFTGVSLGIIISVSRGEIKEMKGVMK
ncbi:MAG: FtsW/RodA/SpoVE family cell cycle protein [Ferruginibacter sp.]|nr:FtsW/RodA/SpoVE family cell cycle protein [Cytophagales bacterium]